MVGRNELRRIAAGRCGLLHLCRKRRISSSARGRQLRSRGLGLDST